MIAVIGLGYVGMTTALYFCERKNIKVYGVDKNEEKKNQIKNSILPFYEPKLEKLLKKHNNKTLFLNDIEKSVKESKYIFICVDTDMKKDGSVNLNSIYSALNQILNYINSYKVIVIRSSIPPTTTENYILPLIKEKKLTIGKDIGLCINPEFSREGKCFDEIINSNRIILGTNDSKSFSMMNDLYKEDGIDIFNCNYTTAEFSKYLSNSLIANMISFSNEMAMLAENLGDIDVKSAFNIIKNDNRWNNCEMRNYVYPIGKFGGYCLTKDTNALYYVSKTNNSTSSFLKDIININDQLENYFVSKIKKEVNKNQKIGILGLSFKPNSDDVRNTSSYYVIKKLKEEGYSNIYAHDPMAIDNFKNTYNILGENQYISDYRELIKRVDVVIVLTIWNEYKNIKNEINKKVIDFTHKL